MWTLTTPWHELVFRALSVFLFLFVIFRIWGKKHFSEMAPFDFLLILILSESVQNALVGAERSVTGGLIAISTLVLLNIVFNKLSYHFRPMEKLLDGVPQVVVHNGKIVESNMKKLTLSQQELQAALRKEGVLDMGEVKLATMETDGKISVVKKGETAELH